MSKYTVTIRRSAEKEMDALPADVFERIANAILKLEEVPRPRGSKKLRGVDEFRIRVGAYRILYCIDDEEHLVAVMAVGHRRDVYEGR